MLKKIYITNLFLNLFLSVTLLFVVFLAQNNIIDFLGNLLKTFVITNLIILIVILKKTN